MIPNTPAVTEKEINVLQRSSQSPGLNLFETMWENLHPSIQASIQLIKARNLVLCSMTVKLGGDDGWKMRKNTKLFIS
ncbi:hypothetical protein ATANTOWER_007030 [Ataeniobius toweri]|uniref:Uncharacterized protein n=1 Tax=Ataeniobius toweri TaxID=208326 RepID=A0ABU7AWG1_9TELE|nr:hypothetical protein [Ataeniobius toweri]